MSTQILVPYPSIPRTYPSIFLRYTKLFAAVTIDVAQVALPLGTHSCRSCL